MVEEYLQIPDHPNHAVYRHSPYNVINLSSQRSLSINYLKGFAYIKISNKSIYLHLLFAKLFHPDYEEGDTISFRDGIKSNYFPENLLVIKSISLEITLDEVVDSSIDLRDKFSLPDISKNARNTRMVNREDFIKSIKQLRRVFASINSTPKVYVFKDFCKGSPILSVGKKADCQLKLGDTSLCTSNGSFSTAYKLYEAYKDLFLYDDICFYCNNPRSFTFFRGYEIAASEGYNEAVIDHFLQFIQHIICDGNEAVYFYLMKWIASIIQLPDTKLEVAVIIVGEPRTGKTTFTNIICHLFGK